VNKHESRENSAVKNKSRENSGKGKQSENPDEWTFTTTSHDARKKNSDRLTSGKGTGKGSNESYTQEDFARSSQRGNAQTRALTPNSQRSYKGYYDTAGGGTSSYPTNSFRGMRGENNDWSRSNSQRGVSGKTDTGHGAGGYNRVLVDKIAEVKATSNFLVARFEREFLFYIVFAQIGRILSILTHFLVLERLVSNFLFRKSMARSTQEPAHDQMG